MKRLLNGSKSKNNKIKRYYDSPVKVADQNDNLVSCQDRCQMKDSDIYLLLISCKLINIMSQGDFVSYMAKLALSG